MCLKLRAGPQYSAAGRVLLRPREDLRRLGKWIDCRGLSLTRVAQGQVTKQKARAKTLKMRACSHAVCLLSSYRFLEIIFFVLIDWLFVIIFFVLIGRWVYLRVLFQETRSKSSWKKKKKRKKKGRQKIELIIHL